MICAVMLNSFYGRKVISNNVMWFNSDQIGMVPKFRMYLGIDAVLSGVL